MTTPVQPKVYYVTNGGAIGDLKRPEVLPVEGQVLRVLRPFGTLGDRTFGMKTFKRGLFWTVPICLTPPIIVLGAVATVFSIIFAFIAAIIEVVDIRVNTDTK